jgi:hypothetical protein
MRKKWADFSPFSRREAGKSDSFPAFIRRDPGLARLRKTAIRGQEKLP